MVDDRSQADRILVAQITGEARHRAKWVNLTETEEAEALAELRALAGGRADLLAEVAGIFEGTSEGEPDEVLARSAARLCRLAGADEATIPAWAAEGRRRRDAARKPPPSGGVHGPRLTSAVNLGKAWVFRNSTKGPRASYRIPVSAPKIRLTAVIMDILDVLTNSSPDDLVWGLRLCEITGYGTGTIYPALERLMDAGVIADRWEDPPPADRPRRRFYELTSTGREWFASAVRAREERRAGWFRPAHQAGPT
jgi:hypothetical protein